jgi:hypothetical protein
VRVLSFWLQTGATCCNMNMHNSRCSRLYTYVWLTLCDMFVSRHVQAVCSSCAVQQAQPRWSQVERRAPASRSLSLFSVLQAACMWLGAESAIMGTQQADCHDRICIIAGRTGRATSSPKWTYPSSCAKIVPILIQPCQNLGWHHKVSLNVSRPNNLVTLCGTCPREQEAHYQQA